MTSAANSTFLPTTAATLLFAWQTTLNNLALHVDDSWWKEPTLRGRREWLMEFASVVALALEIGTPTPSVFGSVGNRMALLPNGELMRLLRFRAWMHRAKLLRKSSASELHEMCARSIGDDRHAALMSDSFEPPSSRPLPTGASGRAIECGLALEGFCLLESEGVWTDACVLRCIEVRFPKDRPRTVKGDPTAARWFLDEVSESLEEMTCWSG